MAENEDGMAVTLRRRRFTLDEYHRMGETGILGEDALRIQHLFSMRLTTRALVWIKNPLLLVRLQSEPEPDVMLLAPRSDFYAAGHPEPPGDVRLLVEVADSSLPYDRRTKFPLYARAGVAAGLADRPGREPARDPSRPRRSPVRQRPRAPPGRVFRAGRLPRPHADPPRPPRLTLTPAFDGATAGG